MIFSTLSIDYFGPGKTRIINHSKRGRGEWRPFPGEMLSIAEFAGDGFENRVRTLDQYKGLIGTVISVSILSHYNGFVTELNSVDVLWI